jgi:hypothetical protein
MKTNLLNPTPAQVKHRNRLWADALLNNKRKARGAMYNDGGRCCLAVAQDVAVACGLDIDKKSDDSFPSYSVREFFGWPSVNPNLKVIIDGNDHDIEASTLNDALDVVVRNDKFNDKGLSHKQIAECVLNTFVHPSKIKQSFKV